MDPPPPPPLPATTLTTTAGAHPPTSIHMNYPDSVESSPRSQSADHHNEPLPPVPGAKLRLMCSFGGHIIPRPHDKCLCYVGGETRIVVVERHSSLSSLCARLSRTLLNGRTFTLKYQLPQEDLDSLVSVTTDEDLDNMIEEYDRINASSSALAPSRIRLFLFFNKPETAVSMGSLLDDAKSDTWFVDALNGYGLLPRNLSDSATMGCLLNIGSDHDLESHAEGLEVVEGENKQVKNVVLQHDVRSTMIDSPFVENTSSSGSSSSSPSLANLPPIRVRVEDQKSGVEEHFVQMSFAQVVQKPDEGYGLLSSVAAAAAPPQISTATTAVGNVASSSPAGESNEHLNRILSDDERLDQGIPVAFRKPPLPLQPVQVHHKAGAHYNLPPPDSVASDTSIASSCSLTKPMYYQDQAQIASTDHRAPASPDAKCEMSVPSFQIQVPQVQDSAYTMPPQQLDPQQHQQQQQHQQFGPPGTHYIPHPSTTPLPISSYYPVYAPPSQQQPLHLPIDQHYPVYVMPATQARPPYVSVQANMVDTTTTVVASTRPPTPPTPTIIAASSAASSHPHPPIYPPKTAMPEMAAGVYRTAVTAAPQLVQIPANQFQQQYVGYSQIPQHPSQSIAVAAPAASANYGYEYANAAATHDQVYYTPHQAAAAAAPLPPQYQTMTPAAAVALADASQQLPTCNNNATIQHTATSQPL